MENQTELEATLSKIIEAGKGILAADESLPTITKRFTSVGIESTEESRRSYRSLLCMTPAAPTIIPPISSTTAIPQTSMAGRRLQVPSSTCRAAT